MIPELTLNISTKLKINQFQTIDFTKERCTAFLLCGKIPVYFCDDVWVKMGIYRESKEVLNSILKKGYCDTQEILKEFLAPYIEEKDKKYFIRIYLLRMNNKKYQEYGSYINKDSIDTGDNYYSYVAKHSEEKIDQEFGGFWIAFNISEIE